MSYIKNYTNPKIDEKRKTKKNLNRIDNKRGKKMERREKT